MTLNPSILARWARAAALLAAALAVALPQQAAAQAKKDSVVLGMVLEPAPGLDPTVAPAAAIGEVVHMSVLEGLTKINMDGKITPLLAESWSTDPDGKVYTFKLKKGVKFHDGEAFDSSDVKFSFERAKAPGSTNKAKKAVFDNISRIDTPDPQTVIVVLNNADGNFLFRMGENTAVILDPKSAPTTATRPIGTGPFKFDSWAKGSSITLVKNDQFRDAAKVQMKKVTFRFINDPAAQVAALLAGDIDGMPRYGALESLKQFQNDPRFTVVVGGTEGKTIMTINNKKKPFDDVRVRRALAAAIDRKAIIDGAQEGLRHADRQPHGAERRRLRRPDERQSVQPGEGQGAAQGSGRADAAQRDADAAAACLRAQGRRDHRLAARQGRRRRQDRERRVGAVALGRLQGQLRPDRDQPRRAARLRPLRRPELLLRLRLAGVPRPADRLQHDDRCRRTASSCSATSSASSPPTASTCTCSSCRSSRSRTSG